MRPNLLNKFRGFLLMKSPLNGRESGSIQEVLELRGILLKSTCRNAQRPEESCQYGYCKLDNLIPFLLVLFCHNLFCFKRLIILIRLLCHHCQCCPCRRSARLRCCQCCLFRRSARLRCCHPWYRRLKKHCPWQAFS